MSIFKRIGKIISAPARAIGHAAATSGIPLLKNAGSAVENVGNAFAGKGSFLGNIGKAAQSAAPLTMFIPGIGPVAAASIAALTSGAGNVLEHGTKAKLSDVAGQAGLAGLEAGGGKFALSKAGGVGKVKSLINSGPGKAVTTYIRKHPLDAAQIALAGAGTVQGAQRGGQADRLRSDALAGLDVNPTIDLGELGPDAYSPYARKLPRRAPLAALTSGGY